MRSLPYPVVIITARDPSSPTTTSPSPPPSTLHGMTVSSFQTLSLTPHPLVSFNVKLPSHTHAALQAAGCFRAHLLAATPVGAALARRFVNAGSASDPARPWLPFAGLAAGPRPPDARSRAGRASRAARWDLPASPLAGARAAPKGRECPSSSPSPSPRCPPRLSGPAVLADFFCEVLPGKCVAVQDHVVVVARVTEVRVPVGERGGEGEGRVAGGPVEVRLEAERLLARDARVELGLVYGNRTFRGVGGVMREAENDDGGEGDAGGDDGQDGVAPHYVLRMERGDGEDSV
ncbi:flavin reductase like domain-containing protein [Lineolata rhizophorae]|uniref:Flavin reductase like domain-containing protein n=1 Tax=Lineolata rhizophorae TaxID=578093 RepID=A0A6A6P6F8_9PEZI|nr:flavin reductase like domain-containing protein [Lineolata rhizophorae]